MDETPELTAHDLAHLRRCVELAREALAEGDDPFGTVLVDPQGTVLHEDRNRTAGGDETRHPELELARWAAAHVAPEDRPGCTVYTSGEHCPMCSAGHAWVGLGRIVYAASAAQLMTWLAQIYRESDGSFLLEHADGSAHHGTTVADADEAATHLGRWLDEDPQFGAGLTFTPVGR
ncbi:MULTISPECIES: nucleoside deaminase [unclassified Knoellia]|uniref:nucleoside deaminase n=1 Tax=Knoellia altitudinis TaxID=3404795 RepID=UPI00360B3AB9